MTGSERLHRRAPRSSSRSAALKADGLVLTAQAANLHVRRWLGDVANARVHGTTGAVPAARLVEERAVMLPAPALKAPPPVQTKVALPIESLQHPLSVYDALLLQELA